jgi:hypothetical protein
MSMRLIQLQQAANRRVGLVEEPGVRLLSDFDSIYAIAQRVLSTGCGFRELIREHATGETLDYDSIYEGRLDWRLLSPIDHPEDPARCIVSGTGLTHIGSAQNRDAMHDANESELTDSMKMFRWGLEGGKPEPGMAGIAPEWFYKGNGTILRAHGESLVVPPHAEDGGEEGEIAGIYLIGPDGRVHRIGMCNGNEFSDHVFEKKNYLNLAGSKIRTCSLGPELVIDPDFQSVPGRVSIGRDGEEFWAKDVRSGEEEMCHSQANIEHHHFKFETHRRPGDLHVHYFGACSLSFGEGVKLRGGDLMAVGFEGFGRPLRNFLQEEEQSTVLVKTYSMT